MGKNMQSLYDLKKQLATASAFSEILDGFFDLVEKSNIKDHQKSVDFAILNEDHELKQVVKIVESMLGHFLSKTIKLTHPMFYEVAEDSFYHGCCIVTNLPMPLTMFYFKDIQTGLFSFYDFSRSSTEIFRFTLAQAENLKVTH
jgi:hypothetical protein